jgi:hypothetical protein
MKEKIGLAYIEPAFIFILIILLAMSLFYGFFVKPKEITYTSYIPTTYKETKTSYITERETLTKTETSSTTLIKITTKTETSISTTTYKIIEDEALITIGKNAFPWYYGIGKERKTYITLEFIITNIGEHSILIDKSLVVMKGRGLSEEKLLGESLPEDCREKECYILTPLNRTALFDIGALLDIQRIKAEFKEEDYDKELQGELFITYKIIETNQFRTFNFTFTYYISKYDVFGD